MTDNRMSEETEQFARNCVRLAVAVSRPTARAMLAEIDALRAEVVALQAWRDAVPVTAIRIVADESICDIEFYRRVNDWLATMDGAA